MLTVDTYFYDLHIIMGNINNSTSGFDFPVSVVHILNSKSNIEHYRLVAVALACTDECKLIHSRFMDYNIINKS